MAAVGGQMMTQSGHEDTAQAGGTAPDDMALKAVAAAAPVECGEDDPVEAAPASNVTRFPSRPGSSIVMPSLTELDEISLDDLSRAVAAGLIVVAPPPAPDRIADAVPLPPARDRLPARHRPGLLARLLTRG